MEYRVNKHIKDFPAWGGAKETIRVVMEKGDIETLDNYFIDTAYISEHLPSDTEVNDALWFERDDIAEYIAHKTWEEYAYGKEEVE